MPRKVELIENTATQYGKPDIERLGLFIEMPYMNGKRYAFPKPVYLKGLNMLPGGRKLKCGTMDGYFDNTYMRLYEGERPPKRDYGKSRKIAVPFVPVGPAKKHATPGDYFGTFFPKPCEYFARGIIKKPRDKKKTVAATFITNPGRKGGPGYANICLNKYPEHQTDRQKIVQKKIPLINGPMLTVIRPQPYFHKNPYKHPDDVIASTYVRPNETKSSYSPFVPYGYNKHDGLFHPFPEATPDRYISMYQATKPKRTPEVFVPPLQAPKTLRHFLTIDLKSKTGVNAETFKTYEPSFTKYLNVN